MTLKNGGCSLSGTLDRYRKEISESLLVFGVSVRLRVPF
jgi:hypothetical protein